MTTELRDLPTLLRSLRETAPPGPGVLSVYLDTSPARIAGQGYLFSLRDGCKALRDSIPSAESEAFEVAVARVERFLSGAFVPTTPGLALFAAAGDRSPPGGPRRLRSGNRSICAAAIRPGRGG